MKTEVAILHDEYPSSIRADVASKLQHLTKFFERTVSIHAALERQRDVHRAELVANVGNGVVLVVEARSESLRCALDDALGRMARVLKRHKAKRIGERRRTKAR